MFEGASGRWPRRRSSPPRRRPAGRPTPSPSRPRQPDRQIKNQDQSSFTGCHKVSHHLSKLAPLLCKMVSVHPTALHTKIFLEKDQKDKKLVGIPNTIRIGPTKLVK